MGDHHSDIVRADWLCRYCRCFEGSISLFDVESVRRTGTDCRDPDLRTGVWNAGIECCNENRISLW